MIRFSPDGLGEAILRPVAMALPQGWVYTEITAPDLRFLAILVILGVSLGACYAARRAWRLGVPLIFSLLCMGFAFCLWLLTGGNGRYFMAFMIFVGPILVATIYRAPFTGSMRVALLVLVGALQVGAVSVNSPWKPFDSLEWVRWKNEAYFQIEVDESDRRQGITYVTFTGQSQAFLAPRFHPDSRWLNLAWFDGHHFFESKDHVVVGMRDRLRQASKLKVFLQAQPRQASETTGAPNNQAIVSINSYLQPFGLRLDSPERCRLLRSRTLSDVAMISTTDTASDVVRLKANAGYWLCEVIYNPIAVSSVTAVVAAEEQRARRAIEKLESLCPRLFPPGQQALKKNSYGYTRAYSASDSSATFVLSEATLYVKFLRALNPQAVAAESVLLSPDFQIDCGSFVSREGLPWRREL